MYKSTTYNFILQPLANTLEDAVQTMSVIEDGMQSYQIADWVMPTIFLKMTGAQEQKLKCIYWDLGSMDLDERYQRFSDKVGEMSCYDEKCEVCIDLIHFLNCRKVGFNQATDIDRAGFLQGAIEEVNRICASSLLKTWYADYYKDYEEVAASFKTEEIVEWNGNEGKKWRGLFKGNLKLAFDAMYSHRNRCAHNSTSFQQNLPRFEVLSGANAIYENYFVRFLVLILLDKLYMSLYKMAINLPEFE